MWKILIFGRDIYNICEKLKQYLFQSFFVAAEKPKLGLSIYPAVSSP